MTLLEAFFLILGLTALMAVYEWRHPHLLCEDQEPEDVLRMSE